MITKDNYTEENSKAVDSWVKTGWIWSRPITHEEYLNAKAGKYRILLTPTVPVPEEWIGPVKGKKVLALASGGGQQGPVFQALGADVTVLDYSEAQLGKEKEVALREGYEINLIRADMTRPLPFDDNEFDGLEGFCKESPTEREADAREVQERYDKFFLYVSQHFRNWWD